MGKRSIHLTGCLIFSSLLTGLTHQALADSVASISEVSALSCIDLFSESMNKIYFSAQAPEHFTYSHDSEIPADDIIKLLTKFGQIELLDPYLNKMTLDEMWKALNSQLFKNGQATLTKKQFLAMAVRRSTLTTIPEAKLATHEFSPTILNSLYLGSIFGGSRGWAQKDFVAQEKGLAFRETLRESVKGALKKLNLESTVGFDGEHNGVYHTVEVHTPTSESSFSKFWEDIRVFKNRFPRAATHVHIGIPAQVPEEKVLAIARIIEMRGLFQVVLNAEGFYSAGTQGEAVNSSSLLPSKWGKNEGPYVRLNRSTFELPFPAHNLEIKGSYDWRDAQRLMTFAIEAVQTSKSMEAIGWKGTMVQNMDERYGSVCGAMDLLIENLKGQPKWADSLSQLEELKLKMYVENKKSSGLFLRYSESLLESLVHILKSHGLWDSMQKTDFYLSSKTPSPDP